MADRQDDDKSDQTGGILEGLPLFNCGWGAGEWDFEPGEAFWDKVAKLGSSGAMTAHMDTAMAGKSSPRVWLILHEPGQPELAAVVALAFAQELGGRDQAALVLDCDDQSQALTGWAERLEAEGWIDLARYGTSVLTSGVPMPFSGRQGYFLGVGSFAPTDVTAREIEQLVNRLRRQADDLILVAPADNLGELWAPAAGIRLLCWDRSARPAAEIERLAVSLAEAGGGLTGLVGFGLPMPERIERAEAVESDEPAESVESVDPVEPVEPVESAESAEPDVPAPVLDDRSDPEIEGAAEDEVDPVGAADDFEVPAAAAGSDRRWTGLDEDDDENAGTGWTDAPLANDAVSGRRGTSGVFWFVATAAVVMVAILGMYWFKYVRLPADEQYQPVNVVSGEIAPERVPGDRSQGDLANQDDPPPAAAAPVEQDPSPAVAVDSSAVTPIGDQAIEQKTDQDAEQKTDPQQISAAGPFEIRPDEPEGPTFTMVPYQTAVGAAGWALHLYSFPAQAAADTELAALHRRGFETEIRVVETREKGRWWRIYVGSFGSKAEARAAAPLLKKKLRTDWANPTRF